MSELNNSNWTIEEKIAFEAWLKISIEMIEKYCTPKETQQNISLGSTDFPPVTG